MPRALLPGITAMRADRALIERAISSASPTMREVLIPLAGSNSKSVTTGPGRTFSIEPLMPKSSKTSSSVTAISRNSS